MRIFFYPIVLICLTLWTVSCSPDETTIKSESETNIEQLASRTAAESFPEFTSFLEGKFGTNYDIKNAEIMFDVYTVSSVYETSTSSEIFKGYFIETPDRNVVYIEEDRVNAKLVVYDFIDNKTVPLELDSNLFSNYPQIDIVPDNETVINNRFFGWGKIIKGPCENNKRVLYKEYYVFWVNTGIQQPVIDISTPPQQLTEPCGEPVLGED